MKKDIENVIDITMLVTAFYTKAIADDTIGYIFKKTPNFSVDKHVPIMISFWETLLFGVASYKGNTMLKHIDLNKKIPLNAEHFKKWIYLWEETLLEKFEGKNTQNAITKGRNIAALMQYKIGNINSIDSVT
jgi:hemoglobin